MSLLSLRTRATGYCLQLSSLYVCSWENQKAVETPLFNQVKKGFSPLGTRKRSLFVLRRVYENLRFARTLISWSKRLRWPYLLYLCNARLSGGSAEVCTWRCSSFRHGCCGHASSFLSPERCRRLPSRRGWRQCRGETSTVSNPSIFVAFPWFVGSGLGLGFGSETSGVSTRLSRAWPLI